ncbi:hypothetical protein [Salinibacterium sp. GXW1014]|uniref:hypothetical protein n=1 Tax=Salinibacterium sp. GXW1014 TaxID=3377838 RepID=UPI00383AAB64
MAADDNLNVLGVQTNTSNADYSDVDSHNDNSDNDFLSNNTDNSDNDLLSNNTDNSDNVHTLGPILICRRSAYTANMAITRGTPARPSAPDLRRVAL